MNEQERHRALFLDRDGVINKRIPGDFVKTPEVFEFLPGVLEALKRLRPHFKRIIILTNQRGINEGKFSYRELEAVHRYMLKKIESAGGKIDAIYTCPHRSDENCACRKPESGLIHQALEAFPEIDLKSSILAGDRESDIVLGCRMGMKTAYVYGDIGFDSMVARMADFSVENLLELAEVIATRLRY